MAFEFSFAWGEPLPPCVEVAVAVLPSLSSPLLVTVGFAQAETDRQIAPADTAESRSFLYIWIASNLELRSGFGPSPHTAGVPRFPIAGRRPPTRHAPRDADGAVTTSYMHMPCQMRGGRTRLLEAYGFNGFSTARPDPRATLDGGDR